MYFRIFTPTVSVALVVCSIPAEHGTEVVAEDRTLLLTILLGVAIDLSIHSRSLPLVTLKFDIQ